LANFYKEKGMSEAGFDKGLVKQTVLANASADIALFGGETDGSPLKVTSNNPGIIELTERGAINPNVRSFKITGRRGGSTMIEARTREGAVWAMLQVYVDAPQVLTTAGRVAEAMRRSLPLLPNEAKSVVLGLISPESILIVTGTMALWAGSHLFGVGEIADIVTMIIGGIFLGKGILDLGDEMWKFGNLTILGKSDHDLDEAAKHFAKAVMLAGVDIIAALLLRGQIKARGVNPTEMNGVPMSKAPKGKLLQAGKPPPLPEGAWFGRPKISRQVTLSQAGSLGYCDWYGDIYVLRAVATDVQRETIYHELVHSILSPKFRIFRTFRANLKASGYWRISLLRFIEESLAESYSMLKTRGVLAGIKAVTFPLESGYVTIAQLGAEGVRIGTIMLAGANYGVFLSPIPPFGMPVTP
jgi:hypothetical protein